MASMGNVGRRCSRLHAISYEVIRTEAKGLLSSQAPACVQWRTSLTLPDIFYVAPVCRSAVAQHCTVA